MFIRVLTLSTVLALTAGSVFAQGDAPVINDGPIIRGKPPTGANTNVIDRAQMQNDGLPTRGQEPINRDDIKTAPPIDDGVQPRTIRGTRPISAQPATDTIPLEIVHFNIRSEDCHPTGGTQAQWNASLAEMEKKPACAAFEKERATLKAEYAGNPLALEALTVKFGYGGPMNHRL